MVRRHPRGLAAAALGLGVLAGAFPAARRAMLKGLVGAAGLGLQSLAGSVLHTSPPPRPRTPGRTV